jgi:filamentous hemagglutinin
MYTVWTNPANELNSFMSDRRSMRDLVAMTASMRGTDKMDGWSNARKLQELNTVFTNAPKPGGAAVAPTPTEPSQADEQARAEAEARARAEEKARAEEARIAAEQKAREEAARLAADDKARAEAAFNPASHEAELAAQAAWLKANEQARADQQAQRDAEYFAQQEANARYLADKLANYGVQQPAAPTMKMGYSY